MLNDSLLSLQAIEMALGVILMGWITLLSGKHLFWLIKEKKYSIRPLLRDFKQKIWMTLGLGSLFFSFYFLIVFFGSSLIDQQSGLSLFFLFYAHPIEFIYLGLFIFACMSLCIYLVRMLIKYLYTNYSKKL